MPTRVSFRAFDKWQLCPKRYCVENLDPVIESEFQEAICIKEFPPMGLEVDDYIDFKIDEEEGGSISYIIDNAGKVPEETFLEHFEIVREMLPDTYWAAAGSAIQAIVEFYIKRHNDIIILSDKHLSKYVEQDIDLMSKCLYPNDTEDETFENQKKVKIDGTIVTEFQYFPVELKNSKLLTIQKRFAALVKSHFPHTMDRLRSLDLSKVKAEMWFNYVDQNEISYGGSADMVIFHDSSTISIYDGKLKYSAKKHNKEQLYFYAFLAAKMGYDVKGLGFWDYHEDKIWPIKVNQYDINRVGKKASNMFDDMREAIEQDDFPEYENYYCKYCLNRDNCETYNGN